MSLQFETTHRFLIVVMRRSGIKLPWVRPESTLSSIVYTATDALLPLICFYQFLLTGSSAFRSDNFQDICNLGVTAPLEGTGVVIYILYIINQKRLQKYIDDCNTLNLKILNNELGQAVYFQDLYLRVAQNNQSFSKKILFIAFCTPLIYCIPVPIIEAVNHSYRSNIPVPIMYPYDYRQPGIYEVTFCLHVIGVTTAVVLKIGNDCFFLALVNIQSVYLKWLSSSLRNLGEQIKNGDSFISRKQILWIKYHAELLRNVNELIAIYSPIIVLYHFYLIIVVVCCLFTQIKNERDNAIQGMGIGGFGLISVFQLYMHSSSAEKLATEAEMVAKEIYNVPWYKMNKSNADKLRLMLLVARRPVQVTAYKAPTFLLNKETFIGFVVNSLTALMTFAKINDRH